MHGEIKKALCGCQSALRGEKTWLLGAEDGVFGGLGDTEFDDLFGGDFDFFASGGITADAGFAVDEHELTQPREE